MFLSHCFQCFGFVCIAVFCLFLFLFSLYSCFLSLSLFVLFSYILMTIFSVMFGLLFLLWACVSCSFWLHFPWGFGKAVYTYARLFQVAGLLISNAIPYSCICTLLMVSGFDVIFMCGWYPAFIVCLPLTMSLPIFFFLNYGLFFSPLLEKFL